MVDRPRLPLARVARRTARAWNHRDEIVPRLRKTLRRVAGTPPPEYAAALSATPPPRVLVVTHGLDPDGVVTLTQWFAESAVHLVLVGNGEPIETLPETMRESQIPGLTKLSVLVRPDPPPELLVVIATAGEPTAETLETLETLLPHVADGGLLVVDSSFCAPDDRPDVDGLAKQTDRTPMVHSATRYGTSLVLRKQGRHFAKLRDRHIPKVLVSRNGADWGAELSHRPEFRFTSRATVTLNDDRWTKRFPSAFTIPNLYTREFADVVCRRRQLVTQGSVVLPLSFHHPHRKVLNNRGAHSVSPELLEVGTDAGARELDGVYFHLDSEFPGHFGHFLTEDLARVWGWEVARERHPDARMLISVDKANADLKPFQWEILASLDVDRADVEVFHDPVRVQTLAGATPQFHNRRFADPDLERVWSRIRDRLAPAAGDGPSRVFISRPDALTRRCRNGPEVEAAFEARGFRIVQPEKLDLAAQVALFADADVVAGYGGSGLFGTMFARRRQTVIVIGPDQYTASNEHLIASVKGSAYHHLFCASDVTHPAGQFSLKAFHSDYLFDFHRDGDHLSQLLDSL